MTDLITRKPSDWDIKNLENIATFITKGATPTTYGFEWVEESSDSIPFLRSECVTANGFNRKGMNFISKKAHVTMGRSKIKSGDILMTITGNIGRIATLPDEIPEANINQHIAKISVIDGVSSSYVAQALQQERYNRYYERILTGQAYPQISLKQVRETPILLPPHPEQQKIAEVLSTVDKKIDLIDQKIAETEKLKTGLMQKLFSEGVGVQDENGDWQPHAEFSSDLLPSSWEVGEVIDFLELQRGHDLPVQKRMGGSVPIIGSNGIAGYHSQAIVEESGVITGRSGTLGKVYFSEGSFWPLNTSLYIRDFKGNNKKYCFYFLEHFNLKRFGTGTGVPTLNRNIVHKQKTAFPSLIEQEKIAEILDTVSQKKQILEQQKAETQQLKKGLMQKLLTGEWRVPVEETEAT